jgi:hypothetical protein
LIFLAVLIPIGIYCLVLAVINRRQHPVVVPGPWDFVGVLFAASGILIVGGPAILTGIYKHWRLTWLLGQTRSLEGVGDNWSFWISLWLLYFGVVAGGSAFVLWHRRRLTSIYNIELAVFTEVLIRVLDRLGLEWRRNGTCRLLVRFRESPFEAGSERIAPPVVTRPSQAAASRVLADRGQPHALHTAISTQRSSTSAHPWAELALEAFPATRHVTLHWMSQNEAIRLEVETELAKALAQMRTRRNPVGAWFLFLGLGLNFSAFFVLLALFVTRILQLLR